MKLLGKKKGNIGSLSVFLILLLLAGISVYPQSARDSEKAIDSIFSQWQKKQVPGVVAGLIYGDNLEYSKVYGYADVKNQEKNTVNTQFQIGYLSRQFVVFGILVLENQSKLSLNDPIQKYVTDFPKFEHELKISHLVNHSSGLDNHTMLRRIIGVKNNDTHTHEEALNLIKSQNKLNYVPGTDFSHMTSKTEITLMLELIKKASSQSITNFMTEHIFNPLGMKNTSFSKDYNSIVHNQAISYQNQGDTLKFSKVNHENVFYTSAEDMLIWYSALTGKSKSNLTPIFQKLDSPVNLENGNEFNSWWGKLTLGRSFYHLERGLPAYWQFGRIGGYASNVFRFPEQNLTSFVMGNNNAYNGMPAMLHANHYIEDKYTKPSDIDPSLLKTKKLSTSALKNYEGLYWDSKRGIARKLEVENDTLFYKRLDQDEGAPMVPLATSETFQLVVEGDEKIVFSFKNSNGSKAYDITLGESSPYTYIEYTPTTETPEIRNEYCGTFYSKNLKVIYDFEIDEQQLIARGPNGRVVVFYSVMKDTFRSDAPEFGSIRFERDASEKISGFAIFTDGIQNLKFTKMSSIFDTSKNRLP
ncbi:serine hydrolase domain-containing protein [Flagellimonas sp. S174]|uniref:serine hydrolase domain-containing protein n=1 Tax=Flagellimonas sp. S174 TaxID=3410790 RepID=UPI003BF51515